MGTSDPNFYRFLSRFIIFNTLEAHFNLSYHHIVTALMFEGNQTSKIEPEKQTENASSFINVEKVSTFVNNSSPFMVHIQILFFPVYKCSQIPTCNNVFIEYGSDQFEPPVLNQIGTGPGFFRSVLTKPDILGPYPSLVWDLKFVMFFRLSLDVVGYVHL